LNTIAVILGGGVPTTGGESTQKRGDKNPSAVPHRGSPFARNLY
jgi:hypothetical protein